MSDPAETARVRAIWQREAAGYDRGSALMERLLFSGGREWVCSQARGDVLEIGIGTGRNLAHYPRGIRLTGVDCSPAMLAFALERASGLGIAVDLREGDAQALDFPDARFDTVVCTLALCSIPDDRLAVAEARRVLRPGGRFLAVEHVRSPLWAVRAVERLLDGPAVRSQGDHLLREPLDHLRAAGFVIEHVERRRLGIVEWVAARRPAVDGRSG